DRSACGFPGSGMVALSSATVTSLVRRSWMPRSSSTMGARPVPAAPASVRTHAPQLVPSVFPRRPHTGGGLWEVRSDCIAATPARVTVTSPYACTGGRPVIESDTTPYVPGVTSASRSAEEDRSPFGHFDACVTAVIAASVATAKSRKSRDATFTESPTSVYGRILPGVYVTIACSYRVVGPYSSS